MFAKRKRVVDERILKESNVKMSKMLPWVWSVSLILLIAKIAMGLPVQVYCLEILLLVAGTLVWLVEGFRYGTLFAKDKDDALKELAAKGNAETINIMFWIVVIGELLFHMLIGKEYSDWMWGYMLIWFPPCLIYTIQAISGGLIIFGSVKMEKDTKKSLRIRTFIGSIFFGLFVGMPSYLHDGIFNPKGLIAVPFLAAGWGIPFYLLFVAIMKMSEKNADKEVERVEEKDEE